MRPGFSARRRAERFQEALERASGGTSSPSPAGPRPGSTPEQDTWVALVEQLRAVPAVQPRPGFVAGLREELMTAAAAELAPSPVSLVAASDADPSGDDRVERLRLSPGRSRRERRLAAAVGGLALVGAGTSMAVASQGALPGDALYPLKRAIENVRTSVPMESDARGSALLDNAEGRLAEAEALSRRGDDAEGPGVTEALQGFVEQASEASDLLMTSYEASGQEDDVREVRDFTAQSMETLTDLAGVVPPEARPALVEAAQVVWGIDTAARRLCPGCGGVQVDLVPELSLDPTSADLGRQLDALTGATVGDGGGADGSPDGGGPNGSGPNGGGADGGGAGGGPGPGGGSGGAGGQGGQGGSGGQGGGTGTSVPGVGTSGTDLPVDGSTGSDALSDLVEGVGETLGGVLGTGPADGAGAGATEGAGSSDGTKKKNGKKGGKKKKNGGQGGGSTQGDQGGGVDDTLDDVTEGLDDLTGGLLP